MQKHVGEVVSTGFQPVNLAIEQVGSRSERVPVLSVVAREGPFHAQNCHSLGDHGVLINVIVIIVVCETVAERLAEDQPGDGDQKKA